MKRLIIFLLFLFVTTSLVFADYFEIGTGTLGTNWPTHLWSFNNYYENNRSQQLYLQSELGGVQTFTEISFNIERVAPAGYRDLVDFYIKFLPTSDNALTTGAFYDMSTATQVFSSASYTLTTATGWTDIDITDFLYNGTQNLIVEIIWGDQGFTTTGNHYRNYKTASTGTVRSLYGYGDRETPPSYDDSYEGYSNIRFHYTATGPGNPTSFNATTVSSSQIDLSWTKNGADDDVMVAWTSDGVFGSPVDGTAYSVGNTITGGGTVLYNGIGTSYDHTSLDPTTIYYYKAWSVHTGGTPDPEYSNGVTNDATTDPETKSVPYSQNFDTQDSWYTSGDDADVWERGDQTNDGFGPPSGHSDNSVYGTKLNANYGEDDVQAFLNSPYIDLAGTTAPELRFWMDMESESGYDGGTLRLRVYSGGSWGVWTTIDMGDTGYIGNVPNDTNVYGLANDEDGWSGTTPTGEWALVIVDLFNLTTTGLTGITNADDIQARFWFGSDGSENAYPGWYIDDFSVAEGTGIPGLWTGTTDTDWDTPTNWDDGIVPTSGISVTIPTGLSNYPVVDETSACNNLSINNGATITVSGVGFSVGGNLTVGQGTSGQFVMNAGSCSVTGNFYTEAGCTVDINGGTLNIRGWYRSADVVWASGTIEISGGTINASENVMFGSVTNGVLSGNYNMNVGGSYRNSTAQFPTVTGGTVTLTGTDSPTDNYCMSSVFGAGNSLVAWDLVINASGDNYFMVSDMNVCGLDIKHDFTVTAGTAYSKNGSYSNDVFNVTGTFSVGSGATFVHGDIPNIDPFGWNLDPTSTYNYAGDNAQTINITPTYGNLHTSGNGLKTVDGNLNVKGDFDNDADVDISDFVIVGRHFGIGIGTTLQGGSGTLKVGGDWKIDGNFARQTSHVQFIPEPAKGNTNPGPQYPIKYRSSTNDITASATNYPLEKMLKRKDDNSYLTREIDVIYLPPSKGNSKANQAMTGTPTGTSTTIWNDDFETDKGWTLTGEFERNAPGALGGEHGNPDPASAHGGSNVLGSDLTGLGLNFGDYEASLTDRQYIATSPVIDCSGYSNVHLEFWRWLNVESPDYDHVYIDVYDGSTWQNVFTNSGTITDNSWLQQNINISTYADGNANMQVRFCVGATDNSWFYSSWNIDDLEITATGAGIFNFYDLTIETDGTVTTTADVHCYNNCTIGANAVFDLGTDFLTIDGTYTNNGEARSQHTATCDVQRDFDGPEGSNDAVTIDPTGGNMDSVTVTVHAGKKHSSAPNAPYRWWELDIGTEHTCTIRFRMRDSEISGQDLSQFVPWELIGSSWSELVYGSRTYDASGTYPWVEFVGVVIPVSRGVHTIITNEIESFIDAPTNVQITNDGTNVTIIWDAVSGAASYNIYSSTDPYAAQPWTEVTDTGSFTNPEEWTVTSPAVDTFYYVTADTIARGIMPSILSNKEKQKLRR